MSPPKTNTAGSTVQELHEVDEDGEHERQEPGLHAEAGQWLEEAIGAGSTVIKSRFDLRHPWALNSQVFKSSGET